MAASPSSPHSAQSFTISRPLKEFLSGSSAGLIATLALHPLDLLKIRLQVSHNSPTARQIVRAISQHAAEANGSPSKAHRFNKTVAAFYRGLGANIAGNTGAWAVYFLLYGEAKALLERRSMRRAEMAGLGDTGGKRLNSGEFLFASASAGLVTQVLTNPLWVVKTRLISTGKETAGAYSGIMDGFRRIIREEGARGLYRGLIPGMFGTLQAAVQFMIYEKFKLWRSDQLPPNTRLSNLDVVTLSASSKIIAGGVTYPYQVLRARLQAYDADKEYRGVRDAIGKIWRDEGVRGFYRGLTPGLLRVLPSTCITLLVYENTKGWLEE